MLLAERIVSAVAADEAIANEGDNDSFWRNESSAGGGGALVVAVVAVVARHDNRSINVLMNV